MSVSKWWQNNVLWVNCVFWHFFLSQWQQVFTAIKNMAPLSELYLCHQVVAESDLAWLKNRPTENRLLPQWTKSRGHGPLVRGGGRYCHLNHYWIRPVCPHTHTHTLKYTVAQKYRYYFTQPCSRRLECHPERLHSEVHCTHKPQTAV